MWRPLLALVAFVALWGMLLALSPGPAEAATFTVNRAGDAGDGNLTNVACDVSLSQTGSQCTLRAAIEEANDTTGTDAIRFNISSKTSVKTISPTSELPEVTEPAVINGYTQPGARANSRAGGNDAILKIQLSGAGAGTGTSGLVIGPSGSTVKGLAINRFPDNRFPDNGISISGSGATGNEVEGNLIGTGADGTGDLGNTSDGVLIANAPGNTIGGAAREAGNVIAHNNFDGVLIFGAGATGNSFLSNRIFANGEIGIDLVGDEVTGNDPDDGDTGPNNLQNFPLITSVTQSTLPFNPTIVSGTLNSVPSTSTRSQTFTVQCFAAAPDPADRLVVAPDPSGHGEGVSFVAQDTTVTTNSAGNASFDCNFFPRELQGTVWTATATNGATGDTSEFSANFTVGSGP